MHHARAIGTALAAVLVAPVPVLLGPAASAAPQRVIDVRELSAPAALSGLAPGDTAEWAAEVTNIGTSPHDLSVAFVVDGPDDLATDPRDGLQLVVDLCPSAFTVVDRRLADGRDIERYDCPDDTVPLGAGPAAVLGRLEGSRPVASGTTIGVRVRVAFPASAGNALEDTDAGLRVVVTEADAPVDTGNGPIAGGGVPVPGDVLLPGGPALPGGLTLPGGLAVTGRDVGAALLGGLIALGTGALIVAAGRRRRDEEEHA
ncbi:MULTISPECIES: hypothetical protein [unclassified Rathayibacter]|uniref:hypothetical protein n=1 Tax=unclassified Rathayibacter TaxID=2609250 RepID=UPI0006F831BB|nr:MULTISPECIES: hypothetical protein [unclassified Rathayibacter]KQQ05910.1 hypothetical protein ASF42_05060 [Rathayibacter sp. Leaf294]KQS13767.1 hypothetical protein ASG06_05070 [Rathayibacter sp. Leaf185]